VPVGVVVLVPVGRDLPAGRGVGDGRRAHGAGEVDAGVSGGLRLGLRGGQGLWHLESKESRPG
jgi:hypothetical protein